MLLYSAFGVASPFLPSFIEARGIPLEQIGMLFAAGTAIRLVSAPLAGRLADRTGALNSHLRSARWQQPQPPWDTYQHRAFWPILGVSLLHAFALAPTTNLADALVLVASRAPSGRFEYGWVRGAGSAAFILGSLLTGLAIATYGLWVIIALQAMLMLAVPFAVRLVPPVVVPTNDNAMRISRAGIAELLRLRIFRRIVLLAALILGSHAMHDTFAIIRWTGAGITPSGASILWSLSVAAEVIVFLFIGPWLLRVFTPAGAIALAAVAGAARWLVAACTADVAALALTQPLHGITFALLHLACMRLLVANVPSQLAATAQALYGTVGVGIATALLTLISGWLYARMGPAAFAVMSVLCLAALPLTVGLEGGEEQLA